MAKSPHSLVLLSDHREGVTSGSGGRIDASVLEQDNIQSGGASMYVFPCDCSATLLWFGEVDFSYNPLVCVSVNMTTDITESATRIFEALGGDVSKGVL